MPLTSLAINVQIRSLHYVRFPMEDGGRTITVHVAASLLTQRGLLDGLSTRNLLLLYNFYRDKIEAAASAKYDQFYSDGSDLVVVASDLE